MRFARTISCIALVLLILGLGTASSSANEIPSLTWERGKTLNVVLGGYAENLDWRIVLEVEPEPIEFSRSARSDTGFIVYSVALPRDLPVGQYQVVAKNNQGKDTRVAAVQIVERFQYSVLEIPRDLIFLLFSLITFVTMQLTIRTWIRREPDGLGIDQDLLFVEGSPRTGSELVEALASQRVRLKRSWAGSDFIPSDFRTSRGLLTSFLPVISLVIGLYCGVTGNLIPFQSGEATALLASLTIIGVIDRYSAKLATIGFIGLYVLFNATLNFPALLGIALLVLMFFLPQYVGDVAREFIARESISFRRRRELREGIASLAAGTSVFWLYLLGESLKMGDGTDASKVTPIAVAAALGYFIRSMLLSSKANPLYESPAEGATVLPVLSLRSALGVLVILVSVIFVWTEEIGLAAVVSLLIGGSLVSINLVTRNTYAIRSLFLSRAGFQLGIVVVIEIGFVLFVSRLPEVVADRARLIILLSGLPIAALAVVRLLTTLPNTLLSAGFAGTTTTESDERPLK